MVGFPRPNQNPGYADGLTDGKHQKRSTLMFAEPDDLILCAMEKDMLGLELQFWGQPCSYSVGGHVRNDNTMERLKVANITESSPCKPGW